MKRNTLWINLGKTEGVISDNCVTFFSSHLSTISRLLGSGSCFCFWQILCFPVGTLSYLMLLKYVELSFSMTIYWMNKRTVSSLKGAKIKLWLYLLAQLVKNLAAVQETRVQSPDRGDPLEKGMPTHSSLLAWGIPWTEEPGGLQSTGSQRVGHDWATNTFMLLLSRSTSQVNFLALSYERLNYTEGRLRDKNCTQI